MISTATWNIVKSRDRKEAYCDIAVGLDLVHPKIGDGSGICEKLLHRLQSKRTQKMINPQGSGSRLLGGWNCSINIKIVPQIKTGENKNRRNM